jgi:hypothetical protein
MSVVSRLSFVTKDSGQRISYPSGFVRDVQTGKPRYDLIYRPALTRWAELMARGAEKYGEDNWRLASSPEELKRFKASLWRHMIQFMDGDESEDHAASMMFNIAACMYVMEKSGIDINGNKRMRVDDGSSQGGCEGRGLE